MKSLLPDHTCQTFIQLVQGTEQVVPTAMIRYMVVILASQLPPHEPCQAFVRLRRLLSRIVGDAAPVGVTLMLPSSAQIGFVLPKMKRSFFLCPKTPSSKDRELAKLCNLLSSLFLRDFALRP
jgi:hypothetical protein